jgi:hypothetical protein
MRRTHYEVEVLYATLAQPLCEQHRDAFACSRPVEMTTDIGEVTCRKCLCALGYEPAPIDQLTVCVRDPLPRAA